jgi:NADH dehydrogenase
VIASSQVPHVVIVGGGFGGLETAKALTGAPARITLVDRSNHHLFQPLLYQVAMAGLSPADIAVPIRSVLATMPGVQVLLGEATHVDLGGRRLHLEGSKALSYDYLVLAYGAKTNFFGHDDWARHSLGMKTVDDALEVRRRVLLAFEAAERETDPEARRTLLTFVVIGGGPTGVEVAGALAELARFTLAKDFRVIRGEAVRVVLVEGQDRLLPGGFDPVTSASALRQLESLGVEVHLSARVEEIDRHGVRLEGGEYVESTTVLWTAGVRAKRLGETLGVPLDRGARVITRSDCSLPDHPEVFCIGDCAAFVPEGEERPLPGVSPVAMQQGRFVARVILDRLRGRTPATTFRYLDKGIMATIGRSRAVAERGSLRLSGLLAWLAWLFVHVWYLIGFRNRFVVLFSWAWSYFTYKRGARLITGDRPWERLQRLSARAEHQDDDPSSREPPDSAPRGRQPPSAATPSADPRPDGE